MKKFYAFAAAAAMVLSANAQVLYITGQSAGADAGGFAADWDPSNPAEFTFNGTDFEIEVAGLSSFKISTAKSEVATDWDTFNGAALTCDYDQEPGATVELTEGDSNIICPWTGDYKVVVSGDLKTLTLTTDTPKPADYGKIKLYLRGDMNEWGAPEEWMFEDLGDGLFKFVCAEDQAINPGDTFKVADDAWTKYNFGLAEAEAVLLDLETELVGGADPKNMSLEEAWNGVCWFQMTTGEDEQPVYWFYLSNDKEAVPDFAEAGSGVETVEVSEDAPAHYYNLQGVEVANPANGIYVVVKGGKSYKTVLNK